MTQDEGQGGVLPLNSAGTLVAGTLHIDVAFDWGDEVDLERARNIVPAERRTLPRRSRTPASIAYRPPPLRIRLDPVPLELPGLGTVAASAESTIFDFGAVSFVMHVPFQLSREALTRLAGSLAEPEALVAAGRAGVTPVYDKLLPCIQQPLWSDLSEEYFVFQLPPGGPLASPERLLAEEAGWLASLVRLEDEPLCGEEVAEALRQQLRYNPTDLFVPEWSAAVLIDQECEETLQTIEFANLQLLEFRHLDNQLDERLAAAYREIHPLARRSWFPFWRSHSQQLRALGELRMAANDVFERTGNVLKLIGDQYLARVYRLLSARFHLEQWERNIARSLEVVEGVYQVLSDQSAMYRTELMEIIVIVLIGFEVVAALVRH